mgnify:CR=1 FL=1
MLIQTAASLSIWFGVGSGGNNYAECFLEGRVFLFFYIVKASRLERWGAYMSFGDNLKKDLFTFVKENIIKLI